MQLGSTEMLRIYAEKRSMAHLLVKDQHKEKTDKSKRAVLCCLVYMLMSLANILPSEP